MAGAGRKRLRAQGIHKGSKAFRAHGARIARCLPDRTQKGDHGLLWSSPSGAAVEGPPAWGWAKDRSADG